MLEIICPTSYRAERQYIVSLLMDEFWNIDYRLSWSDEFDGNTIFRSDGHSILLRDGLFRVPEAHWLTGSSLPRTPLERYVFSRDFPELAWLASCPLLYMADELQEPVHIKENSIAFNFDILGSCFFMLTRYEEMVDKTRDGHGRFPAMASLAYKEGFLERPVVNEYLEVLWAAIHRLFPLLQRKKREFRLIPTHDIDHPFGMTYESVAQVLRHLGGDVLYRRGIAAVRKRLLDLWELHFRRNAYVQRKKETYTFLYQISRKYKLRDMYFFMNSKCSQLDGNYLVDEPEVKMLLREIHSEGHAVGLHPSYISYLDKKEILRETVHANQVLSECGLPLLAGARQHYLRWSNPETWQNYEDVGLPIDSSLGFADWVGFRCGICYEYPVFNLRSRKQLRLREKPLIVMDGTLTDYMHLSESDAKEKVLSLAQECMRYSGDFVFLWHNTMLDDGFERAFYQDVIERIFETNERCTGCG